MSELEKYILSHREAFDAEPSEGHLERFQSRLARSHRKRVLEMFWPAMKIAALITLIIFSGMWVFDHTFRNSPVAASFLPVPEYRETEQYFATQVNSRYDQIRSMRFVGDSLQKKMLLSELAGMDSLYLELQKDLEVNPGDERVLQAMIEYYQLKLDILNNIIQQLNTLQQQNSQTDHEKTNL